MVWSFEGQSTVAPHQSSLVYIYLVCLLFSDIKMTLIKEKKNSRNKLDYIDSFLNTVSYFFESNGLWNLGFMKTDDSSSITY